MTTTKKQLEEALKNACVEIEVLKQQLSEAGELHRERMPEERDSSTHRFRVGSHDCGFGHLIVGRYPDGRVGEIFIKMKNDKSMCACGNSDPSKLDKILDTYAFMSGILNQFAISVSIGLQYGVPLSAYIEKFKHVRFPPEGRTANKEVPFASSIVDYIFRYIELRSK